MTAAGRTTAPPHWRARPPQAALAWAVTAMGRGARLRRVRAMRGGGWLAVHRLDIEDAAGRPHAMVLRRWARPGWELTDPDYTAAREAGILARLAGTDLPVPRVIAVDGTAASSDVPAILLTLLPGRPRARAAPLSNPAITRLAEMLVRINDLDGDLRTASLPFTPFWEAAAAHIPAGSRRRDLWLRAIEIAATQPEPGVETFMHRDYHPGNVLWTGAEISGIIDWTGACWGPPAAELGHLRVNLAADHGVAEADTATRAYLAAGGRLEDAVYWDIRMLLDWLPDLDESYASGGGLDRMERYLEALLRE